MSDVRIELDAQKPLGRLVYSGHYTSGWLTAEQARRAAFKTNDGQQRAANLALAQEIEKAHPDA
jgi:hypothetical protein